MRVRPGHIFRDLLRSDLSSRSAYQYEPLPSPRAIRLLRLHAPSTSGEIHCSLEAFDQGNAPPYHALSYTWGYPLTPFSDLSKLSSFGHLNFLRKIATTAPNTFIRDGQSLNPDRTIRSDWRYFPITCNGRTMLVTANLLDGLRMLRGLDAEVLRSPFGKPKKEKARHDDGSQYFWIDAVCVDQANIAERNAQVAMMARTFRAARGAVVWLGMEDQFTAEAIELIETVSSLPRETWGSTRYTDFFDPAWQARAGGLTYRHWVAFIAFMNRPWFRRAWVVQELALAREALLICGEQSVSWAKLDTVLDFVQSKRWYHHLSTKKISHLESIANDPGPYREFLQSETTFGLGSINLSRTRRWSAKRKGNLGVLMQMHRETEATDPRDKVYAFLGLSDGGVGCTRRKRHEESAVVTPVFIQPDYKLAVRDVYTDATMRTMLGHGDLRMLSHVQDASHTKIQGLPTWVPDYSARLQPYPLSIRGKVDWNASGSLKWEPDVEAMKMGRLHVRGFRIGVVQEAALMPDEAGDSARYWAGVIRVAASLEDYGHPVPSDTATGGTPKPQTRIEVFWRTLITDTYSRQNPAPASVGTLVLDYALNLQIRHTLAPWSNVDFMPHQSPTNPSTTEAGRTAWPSLLAAEPEGSPYGPEIYRERISSVVEGMLKGDYSPIGLAQLQHEFDIASGDMRRVFRTEKDGPEGGLLLGTGPRSLRKGDEVWVLGGAAVPIVLRRTATAVDNGTYSLVGEAYVHGAMYGNGSLGQDSQNTPGEVVDIVVV